MVFILLTTSVLLGASVQKYKNKAQQLHLSQDRYWHLLLHMNGNESEIDDDNFFFAPNGSVNPSAEINATIEAFTLDNRKDDNASMCRFPARYRWLKEKLDANFSTAVCSEYNKILQRVDPKSVTLVFPSAHINSPASMFGHTFLRINSSYNSKLLSYAVNYAANADTKTENGVVFAIKGLVGGYYGLYSLLPYYEKLKEYRDTEQRDIWEYNLNFTQEEVVRMFEHIWELNGTHSYYYFFTENCSYNMLWFLEVGRPSLHLREKFFYQVIPLETVHVLKNAGVISSKSYRPSKRAKLLRYEELLKKEYINFPIALVNGTKKVNDLNNTITLDQKRYILESAIEYVEYQYSRGKVKKEKYLELFHQFTTIRATLGIAPPVKIITPPNPIDSHRAVRVEAGAGVRQGKAITLLGVRAAYHDLEDSNYGFLRGTQIEFLNFLGSYSSENRFHVEKATLLSIVSIAQRSAFFKPFSWRMKLGFDNDFLSNNSTFSTTIGAGLSWGNQYGFMYVMLDPLFYYKNKFTAGIGSSFGINIDYSKAYNLNFEVTQRFYDSGDNQFLVQLSQGTRISQNLQLLLRYDYKEKYINNSIQDEQTARMMLRYYF